MHEKIAAMMLVVCRKKLYVVCVLLSGRSNRIRLASQGYLAPQT